MSVFTLVKEQVDILDAAGRYGLEVNRHKKAICPFHNDTNPSLSFKGSRFTCFSCGVGGDVIDLVGHLIRARSPIETVNELNSSYHLGIDLKRPADHRQLEKLQRARAEKAALEEWERKTCNLYARYCRSLRRWKWEFAPQTMNEQPHPLFVEACTRLDYMDYLYKTVFINGTVEDKKRFYLSNWLETTLLERRFGKGADHEAAARAS